ENASSKELTDANYAKMMLHLSDINYTKRVLRQLESVKKRSKKAESDIEKRAVIKVLLFSTWLHRLYFITRSLLMGVIGAVTTFLVVSYFGLIDAIEVFVLGILVFVFSLVITRFFDAYITKATKKIIELLASHRTIRNFIMNHF
ncbi:MAG: hypothetical protein P8Y18_08620, partial [Candidatus Bathyarchaeota archaeon]